MHSTSNCNLLYNLIASMVCLTAFSFYFHVSYEVSQLSLVSKICSFSNWGFWMI